MFSITSDRGEPGYAKSDSVPEACVREGIWSRKSTVCARVPCQCTGIVTESGRKAGPG